MSELLRKHLEKFIQINDEEFLAIMAFFYNKKFFKERKLTH